MRFLLILLCLAVSSIGSATGLNGRWMSNCEYYPGRNVSELGEWLFDGTTAIHSVTVFDASNGDSACDRPIRRWKMIFDQFIRNPVDGAPDDVFNFDLRVYGAQLTELLQSEVEKNNRYAVCGRSDWQLGIPNEISGRNCGVSAPGGMYFDYFVELRTGFSTGYRTGHNNGITSDRRTIFFNDSVIYQRQ